MPPPVALRAPTSPKAVLALRAARGRGRSSLAAWSRRVRVGIARQLGRP
jgi:hypothetical protein